MKASAAFLRQIDLVDIASAIYKVDVDADGTNFQEHEGVKRMNIIRAFRSKKGALGYRFFIQKPKDFLFVGDNWPENSSRLLDVGIQFIKTEEFVQSIKTGNSYAHPFLIYEDDEKRVKDVLFNPSNNTLLTLRQICVHKQDKTALLSAINRVTDNPENMKDAFHQIKKQIWEMHISQMGYHGPGYGVDSTLRKGVDKDTVVLLHHASGFDEYEGKKVGIKGKIWLESLPSRIIEKLPYYGEVVESGSDLTEYIDAIRPNPYCSGYPDIVSEIFEAYQNRIVIIDERVQRFAEESSETDEDSKKPIDCWRLFQSTETIVPRRSVIPLDPNSFHEKIGSKTIKDLLIDFILNNCENSFLLIHYGILERVFKDNDKEKEEKVIAGQLKKWAQLAKRVIVTSGRGAHSLKLPDSVCFANLSSVLYACCENRNKYLINYLLNQSRRKRQ